MSPHPPLFIPLTPLLLLVFQALLIADPPAFHTPKLPDGWSLSKGESEHGLVRSKNPRIPLEVRTTSPQRLPTEATFEFRATVGDSVAVQVLAEDPALKPLLHFVFRPTEPEVASISVSADGEALPLACQYTSVWRPSVAYGWRYPRVKNLWDESTRKEIGAAYATLAPFSERTFHLRMVLGPRGRSLWLDDRFLAEVPTANPEKAYVSLVLGKEAQVLAVEFGTPRETGRFLPLTLEHYSHRKVTGGSAVMASERVESQGVPLEVPVRGGTELRLADSLYRYRQTFGSGPNVPYVDAAASWPGGFDVDPAALTLRVPYRAYGNVWLLAWVDQTPNALPKGVLRFYRQSAGYAAATPFEISEEAIRAGLVRPFGKKTAEGGELYLIRVPVDAAGLYGLRDAEGRFLDLELSKPVALGRSYPDPIYYGEHGAGLPSSLRVVAVTLEEGAFDFAVKPSQTAFVYEQPEPVSCGVRVRNTRSQTLEVRVRALTESFNHKEKQRVDAVVQIPGGESKEVELRLPCSTLGWHDLRVEVEGAGEVRTAPLSLVLLPPNKRTYGMALNETRFGVWELRGHYVPPVTVPVSARAEMNEKCLALYRRLGIRRVAPFSVDSPDPKADRTLLREQGLNLMEKYQFLPVGAHTIAGNRFEEDPEKRSAALQREVANVLDAKRFPGTVYYYGGEWGISREVQHGPWPRYTGDGDRPFTEIENANLNRHIPIFADIGRAIRKASPDTRLVLQWGAVNGTFAYIRNGFPRDLVDMYGMDAPHFELMPEISNVTGSINEIWQFRQEVAKQGWPQLPISWTEGPFFPTNPGALTETEQAEYQIRYWLLAMAYGVNVFESGIVSFDAGNYYGAEHYGAGIFRRTPFECPKPAVAAVATATAMLCGADAAGTVPTDSLTTYAMAFERGREKNRFYALWRASGRSTARVKITAPSALVTDAMGAEYRVHARDGWAEVPVSSSPVWITEAGSMERVESGVGRYEEAPAPVHRPLVSMAAANWVYDGAENKAYAHNHFAIRRVTDSNLRVDFGQGEDGYLDALGVTLPPEPGDRPLANRYGALKLKKPAVIPGKAAALGVYIKGNSSWGRVVYQLRDAKGEVWTSHGTKDDWNCDDTHGWSYVHFDGWRYVRFPLPVSHPYDAARGLETTWWGSSGGDGIVDLPLTLERIFVEARNEVPWLGTMKQVPERTYKLSQVVAEYTSEADTTPAVIATHRLRAPAPVWVGPTFNPMARLQTEGFEAAPAAPSFSEPEHFNDGRSMIVHFEGVPDRTYNLYLSLHPDGRGAELHQKGVKTGGLVRGLRPETAMYFFLTAVAADKRESKPSAASKLTTHDNFAEK
jgi:hypothetical protein